MGNLVSREFLDIPATVAEFGGSPSYWRKCVFERRLATYRRGDRVLFRREEIIQFLLSTRVPAAAEAGQQVSA